MAEERKPAFTPYSPEEAERLQVVLNRQLGPEYISYRQGPGGGGRLTYIEGWKVINIANEVFGFNGWSSSIVNVNIDFADYNEQSGRWTVGASAVVRVTLKDGCFHEDTGHGQLENAKSKAAAFDKCRKEAVTDALKRSLRQFGNVMGNCLYSKAFAVDIGKMKAKQLPFKPESLYSGPEQTDVKKEEHLQAGCQNPPTSEYENDVDDGIFAGLIDGTEAFPQPHLLPESDRPLGKNAFNKGQIAAPPVRQPRSNGGHVSGIKRPRYEI